MRKKIIIAPSYYSSKYGTFFSVANDLIKIAKKVPFAVRNVPINSQAIGKPFCILLIDRCQPFGTILSMSVKVMINMAVYEEYMSHEPFNQYFWISSIFPLLIG